MRIRNSLIFGLVLAVVSFAQAAPSLPLPPVVGVEYHHTVHKGENLYVVARHYEVALDNLAFANGLKDQLEVKRGTRLTIPARHILPANPPADGLVVNLPERGIYLFRRGRFVKFFPIAIGRPGFETPLGKFKIISKVKNPTWLPPEWAGLGENVIPAGPENPLGDRWMGLSAHGIGIHATTEPQSIGDDASHGCMRMYPSLAHELYQQVAIGMPVRIEYETAKLGQDSKLGKVYLAMFPDVYNKQGPVHEAQRLLKAVGLASRVDESKLAKLAARHEGRPIALFRTTAVSVK